MQFEVYRNVRDRQTYPFVLVVQHDLLDAMRSRVVVPLTTRKRAVTPVPRLQPTVTIEGLECVLVPQLIGAVPVETLTTLVTNLGDRRAEIIAALDVLLTGF